MWYLIESKISNINFIFTDDKIEHSNTVTSPRCAVSGEVGTCVYKAHGLSILDIWGVTFAYLVLFFILLAPLRLLTSSWGPRTFSPQHRCDCPGLWSVYLPCQACFFPQKKMSLMVPLKVSMRDKAPQQLTPPGAVCSNSAWCPDPTEWQALEALWGGSFRCWAWGSPHTL